MTDFERALAAEAAFDRAHASAAEDRHALLDRIGKLVHELARVQSALGTAESGDALVAVAAKARRDQRVLAAVEDELQNNHDIGWEGEPNAYMQLTTFIDEHKEGRR